MVCSPAIEYRNKMLDWGLLLSQNSQQCQACYAPQSGFGLDIVVNFEQGNQANQCRYPRLERRYSIFQNCSTVAPVYSKCMEFWGSRYQEKDFVRFTAMDIEQEKIIGMAEVCPSYKYSADGNCMGILRLDLLLECEAGKAIQELMEMLLEHVYEDFHVRSVIMKAREDVFIRRNVLKSLHFVPAQDECSIPFQDYFIRY